MPLPMQTVAQHGVSESVEASPTHSDATTLALGDHLDALDVARSPCSLRSPLPKPKPKPRFLSVGASTPTPQGHDSNLGIIMMGSPASTRSLGPCRSSPTGLSQEMCDLRLFDSPEQKQRESTHSNQTDQRENAKAASFVTPPKKKRVRPVASTESPISSLDSVKTPDTPKKNAKRRCVRPFENDVILSIEKVKEEGSVGLYSKILP